MTSTLPAGTSSVGVDAADGETSGLRLGAHIRRLRKGHGLTLVQVAEATGTGSHNFTLEDWLVARGGKSRYIAVRTLRDKSGKPLDAAAMSGVILPSLKKSTDAPALMSIAAAPA